MNKISTTSYIFAIFLLSQCICQKDNSEIQTALKSISDGSQKFALDLFLKAATTLKDTNSDEGDFMISPLSIWSGLILILEGASGNTLTELQNTLRIDQNTSSVKEAYKSINTALNVNTTNVQISNLQAIFTDKSHAINKDYEDTIQQTYQANFVPVDFKNGKEAATIINDFVKTSTQNLIKELVYPEDLSNAYLILISTIFFNGKWAVPFDKSDTKEEDFYGDDGKAVGKVNMMFKKERLNYGSIPQLDSVVFELPYDIDNNLCMIVVLPNEGVRLFSVISKLASVGPAGIFDVLQKVRQEDEEGMETELFFPRFTTETDFNLNSLLIEMGIRDLFSSKLANLSKISEQSLHLSRIIHKTTIEVTENGTVASAATALGIDFLILSPTIKVNRPFAYFIVEKSTGSLLFLGQIKNPGVV
ncbi:SRPN8 family protein [Megaselia abdita]